MIRVILCDDHAVVRRGIRDTLIEFLHDWLYWVCDADRARVLTAVVPMRLRGHADHQSRR